MSPDQPGINFLFRPFPFFFEFIPPEMEEQLLIFEEEDFIPFLINPNSIFPCLSLSPIHEEEI